MGYSFNFLKNLFIHLFAYLWLRWVFVAFALAFSSCGEWGCSSLLASHCIGISCGRAWALGTQASGVQGIDLVVVAHGLSSSAASRMLLDQGSNSCPLHWQADAYLLHHQGSPLSTFIYV